MKKCGMNREIISRFIDDDLDESQAALVKTHLESCPLCKSTEEKYRTIKDLLDSSFSEKPLPLSVIEKTVEINRRSPVRSRRFLMSTGFIRAAGVSVVLCIALALTVPFHKSNSRSSVVFLENGNLENVCAPLSSIVYYEELSGIVVQSQFVKLSQSTVSDKKLVSEGVSYKSPLFNDYGIFSGRLNLYRTVDSYF